MTRTACLLAAAIALGATLPGTAEETRQGEVARRGPEVMPFTLGATTHVFTKTVDGGIQQVIAKDPADATQIRLVRSHLQDIRARFARGDFSGPTRIHGADMPGLAALKAAEPGAIVLTYRELPDGAELSYRAGSPRLVQALHLWFDAQLADHGADAMAEHPHRHGDMHQP
jgi:hypothetical protein